MRIFLVILFFICLTPLSYGLAEQAIDVDAGKKLYAARCASCHKTNGQSPGGNFPQLAGQSSRVLEKALMDYQTAARPDAIMSPIAKLLTPTERENLIAYMASFTPAYGAADPTLRQRGEKLYRAGDVEKQIPACAACHGAEGSGNAQAHYPALAGQNSAYVIAQLQRFQQQQRQSDPNGMMEDIAEKLSPQDLKAVASFVEGLSPGQSTLVKNKPS